MNYYHLVILIRAISNIPQVLMHTEMCPGAQATLSCVAMRTACANSPGLMAFTNSHVLFFGNVAAALLLMNVFRIREVVAVYYGLTSV